MASESCGPWNIFVNALPIDITLGGLEKAFEANDIVLSAICITKSRHGPHSCMKGLVSEHQYEAAIGLKVFEREVCPFKPKCVSYEGALAQTLGHNINIKPFVHRSHLSSKIHPGGDGQHHYIGVTSDERVLINLVRVMRTGVSSVDA
ncbi:hypothetical protein R3P38DRAFT_2758924 [Favolaschia claudopus]|uniref:RRM domain-containing protein n=1 Tax=Favolaschia claudopus TaxID=2862362 RepID=A0AAW0E3Q9_9AGAR